MSMTSRLAIEIDSRSAEQKVEDMRKALQGLNDAGLRVGPAMNGANNGLNSAGQGARSAQTQMNSLERQMKSLAAMASGIAGPLAAAFSVKALYDASEAYTSLNSRMKLVTETGAQLAEAQKAVFQIAQSSYQPLTATAELYQRIAQNQKELGISSKQVAGVVGTISKSLAVSGASASAANAALVQLGQAFASGTLRGEELNSVMEQAPALAQAIAKGMGIGVGQLRMLGQEGKLTAEAVIKALESQEKAVADLFDKTNVTIGNSLTALGNSATRFIGEIDQFTGTSSSLSAQVVALSKSIDSSLPGALDAAARSSSTLEQIMTTGLYAAIGRVVGGLAQQSASAVYAANQNQKLATETSKTASTFGLYAEKERDAAKADFEKAKAGVTAAQQQAAANDAAAAGELKRRQGVLQTIEAERAQAQQRVRNALSEEGRVAAQAKLEEVNRRRVSAISQITLAEQNLARVTQASTAQIQASYAQRGASAEAYAAATAAANSAAVASDRAAAAASLFTRTTTALRAGILSLTAAMGGPLGLLFITGAVAASFIDFGSKADEATKALDQQGLTVDEIVKKYDALNASQQRIKRLEWIDEQKSSLAAADEALKGYVDRINNSTLQGAFAAKGIGDLSGEFNKMIAEVRAGQRDLDSVNQWLKESIALTPQHEKVLAKTSAEYTRNTQRNKELEQVLGLVNKAQGDVAASANQLSGAQGNAEKQTKAQTAEIDKYLGKLREQITLYGASKQKIAEYEASKLGMNAQQKEEARILGQIQVVQENYREALKKNDKARMESLKVELTALITQRNAAEDAAQKSADAIAKIHWTSDKALGESVNRRITELTRLSTFASTLQARPNFLTGQKAELPSIQGRGMVPIGAPTSQLAQPKTAASTRQSVAAEVSGLLGQITETTNAATKAAKAYTESAGQKMLNQASEQAAVLREQSLIYDKQVGQVEKIGPEQQKLIKWEQQLADIKSKQTLTADQKSLLANEAQITAALKANAAEEKRAQVKERIYEMDKKSAEFQKQVLADLELAQQDLDNQLAGVGLGQEGRRRLQEDLKIRQDYQKKMNDLQEQLNKGELDKATYDKETKLLENALAERLRMQENYYRQLEAQQSNWANGATSAYQDYVESAKDIAGQTYDVFSSAFQGMEDALLDFVMTGKLNFKDLANSIIADIARIIIRTQVVAPLLNSVFGGGGGITGGGGGIGAMFSDGSGGGGFSVQSMISGAKTVVDVASSKFVDSVVKGWATGGDSIVNSITGAFEGGSSYVSSAITSAFSTGSQTATTIIADGVSLSAGNGGAAMVDLYTGSNAVYSATGEVIGNASTMTTQNAMGSALGQISMVLSYIQGVYSIFTSFKDYGLKGAAVTGGTAAAGAYIGSFFGPLGTAAGFAIGAALGAIGADKWFGTGEKYEELASSASGTYSNGSFEDRGWVEGWKDGTTRFGTEADRALTGYAQQFSTTLGMLYDTLGNGADVATDLTMRRRRTSGNYSSTFETTLDNGLSISHLAEYGGEIETRLNEFYDDYMGTFLAKAIVGSESLPQYFRAQFSKYADDWDVTAETVIAAIEGVFTRFEGVNSALDQVRVKTVEMGETGLIASDSILNMVAKIADLDVDSATAKDKVKALQDIVNGYYSAFFSADEQFSDLSKNLEGSFGAFGLRVPETRAAYRAMVEDIDVTTSAGQAMFATFMGLATNADAYFKVISDRQQAYYSAFYSEAENTARSISETTAQLKEMGITLPSSRAEYRKLVEEAAKATTESGKAMYDTLMAAAQAAGTVFDALDSQAAAVAQKLNGAVDANFAAVQRSINAQKTSVNDMLATARSNASGLTSISNALSNALKALQGDSDDAVRMLRAQAKATVTSALAIARAGGSLSGFEGLENALGVISTNDTALYSSLEDFNREQGRNANLVAELNGLNGKQLTASERTVKALEEQLAGLDKQLEYAQAQLDAFNGIDTSIKSVEAAIRALNGSLVAALVTKPSTGAGSAMANTPANNAAVVDTLYQQLFGRTPDAGENAYWAGRLQSGNLPYAEIVANMTQYASAADKERMAAIAAGKIPAFASGGLHSGGIRLVGERGPEIELTGPSRIISNSDAAKALRGGGSEQVVSELKAAVSYLYMITKYSEQTASGIRRQNEAEEVA